MSSDNIEFIYQDKIFKIKNPNSNETLLNYIRTKLKKTGTKEGCSNGNCGACTVHFDGRAIDSCLALGVEADGHEIVTIEGLASDGQLHPVQEAFIDYA